MAGENKNQSYHLIREKLIHIIPWRKELIFNPVIYNWTHSYDSDKNRSDFLIFTREQNRKHVTVTSFLMIFFHYPIWSILTYPPFCIIYLNLVSQKKWSFFRSFLYLVHHVIMYNNKTKREIKNFKSMKYHICTVLIIHQKGI